MSTRHLYRALLRELPPRPFLTTPRAPLHQRLRETFQAPTQQTPTTPTHESQETQEETQAKTSNLLAQSREYLAYLRAQRTYVTLLERYNPGMGMDEEERVRLTARRVGMDLPVEYGVSEGGEGEGNGKGNGEGSGEGKL